MVKENPKTFLKAPKTKIYPRSDIDALLHTDDNIINGCTEKTEMLNRYFCSVFGMKQKIVSTPSSAVNGLENLLLILKDSLRKHFKSILLNNLHPRKELAGELFEPLMLIFNNRSKSDIQRIEVLL